MRIRIKRQPPDSLLSPEATESELQTRKQKRFKKSVDITNFSLKTDTEENKTEGSCSSESSDTGSMDESHEDEPVFSRSSSPASDMANDISAGTSAEVEEDHNYLLTFSMLAVQQKICQTVTKTADSIS